MNTDIRKLAVIAGTLIFVFLLTPVRAQAKKNIVWEEEPQFTVLADGKLDVSAKMYRPSNHKPYLIYSSDKFSSLLLIDLAKKSIKELPRKSLKVKDEYSLISKGIPKGKSATKYKLKGGASVFKYKGKSFSIKVKESLIGRVHEGIILAHSPEYGSLRDMYKPNAKHIKSIRKHSKSVEIVVMFATWCSTCKKVLPKFFKVMEAAGSGFDVTYIGVAMGGSEPREELERYGHDSPAFIFYRKGEEIGRIIGDPPFPIEQRIAEILKN